MKFKVYPDENISDLLFGELKLIQKRKGVRYSVDALLISDFVLPLIKKNDHILEIGCGSGVISLILARRSSAKKIIGVEIQKSLSGMAKRNVELNKMRNRIEIINMDAKNLTRRFKPGSFDVIISNPPFRKLGNGMISPNKERAIARYELKMKMSELIAICNYLVKPKGKLALIYPFERMWEMVSEMEKAGLEISRLKFAYHKKGDPLPVLFCVEASKTRKALKLEKPWLIETEKGRFHLDRD